MRRSRSESQSGSLPAIVASKPKAEALSANEGLTAQETVWPRRRSSKARAMKGLKSPVEPSVWIRIFDIRP